VVAGHADVVVARFAFEAVVACVGGWDGVSTYVAESCEVEGTEDEVCDGGVVGPSNEGCGFGCAWGCVCCEFDLGRDKA
jgi:hypothetical protein